MKADPNAILIDSMEHTHVHCAGERRAASLVSYRPIQPSANRSAEFGNNQFSSASGAGDMTKQLDEETTQRDPTSAGFKKRDDGDVRELWEAMNRRSAITNWMIAVIAGCSILYFASALLIPFTIAILGYLSLRHTVVRFCRLGLSRTLAAMAVMAILLGIVVTLGGVIYSPAREWLLTTPESVAKVKVKLQELRQPLETIDAATDDLGKGGAAQSADQVVHV